VTGAKLAIAIVAWLGLLGGGLGVALHYESTPGAAPEKEAPRQWPAGALERAAGKATLVMFAHPKCPCTRASIAELAELMNKLGDSADAYVLFLRPSEMPEGWERSSSWASAERIPHVRVATDVDGALAKTFGAKVSGYTVLYDARGAEVFSGGITSGRGHVGDNEGVTLILALVRGERTGHAETPTFGCDLEDPTADEAEARP